MSTPVTPYLLAGATAHALAGPVMTTRAAVQELSRSHAHDPEVATAVAAVRRADVVLDGLVRLHAALRPPLLESVSLDHALRAALRRLSSGRPPPDVAAGRLGSVWADEAQTVELLTELLDNVARHVGPGRRATVRTAATPDAGVALSLSDDGDGLPDVLLRTGPRPFARHDGDGAGCGLSVAASIAAGAGGQLELATADGGGALVTAMFPGDRS